MYALYSLTAGQSEWRATAQTLISPLCIFCSLLCVVGCASSMFGTVKLCLVTARVFEYLLLVILQRKGLYVKLWYFVLIPIIKVVLGEWTAVYREVMIIAEFILVHYFYD